MSFLDRLLGKGRDATTQREFSLEDFLAFLAEHPTLTGAELSTKIGAEFAGGASAPLAEITPPEAAAADLTASQDEPALQVTPFAGAIHNPAGASVDLPPVEVEDSQI